jgi:hypothetical protein
MNTVLANPNAIQATSAYPGSQSEISGSLQFAAFIAAFLVIVSRRPDALLHAQFYAEDGAIWFAEAYNWGPWKALFWTYNGYIQVLPRLIAALAVALPTSHAPLIENLAAIAIQALPVNILLSRRSAVWGSLNFRITLSLVYLALPNSSQMMGTITESQWILAFCVVLLSVGTLPLSTKGKAIDLFVFSLFSITGPFCIFLLPIALLTPIRKKHPWHHLRTAILLAGSLIQLGALLLHGSSRYHTALGASMKLFVRILGGQIYLGTLFGANVLSAILSLATLLFVFSIGTWAVLLASSISPPMRRFTAFAGAVFIASLAHPIVYQVKGAYAWEILNKTVGTHYWFLPSLTFAWSIAYCLRSRNQLVQIVAGGLAFLMVIGVVRDYRAPAFVDLKFADYAARLRQAPGGAVIVIPQNPDGWQLKLIKH